MSEEETQGDVSTVPEGSNDPEDNEITQEDQEDDKSVNEGSEDTNQQVSSDLPDVVPDYKTQKEELQPLLTQRLSKGNEWYLIDHKWLKQWKKYTGYDNWDQYSAGKENANPGPIDNSNLFKNANTDQLKDHLMEELDYSLLPKPAYEKLVHWYGLSPGSKPICRRVVEFGTYVKHLKVEVYLFDLKLCVHPNINETTSIPFSRADTIKTIQEKMVELYEIPNDVETRIWQRYMSNTYELLSNLTQTLSDAGIYGGQLLMIEKKNKEGQWPRGAISSSSSNTYNTRSSGGSSYGTSSSYSSSSYFDKSRQPTTPGLCGLSNLGNTCFMNSALQCLSNTTPLVEYFIDQKDNTEKPYKRHINKKNPLGMGGALAETYGQLLDEMWSGQTSYLAPRQFKLMIGKHAPQFSGFQQHDSHELLAFLLDGLHEDLNLVKDKPYVDMNIETKDRNDKEIAEETWHKYLLRNQSVIVRLFQGQYKSTLNCPKCSKTSRIFDPFMYLSLPIPIKKTRDLCVYLIRADPSCYMMKIKLTVPKNGNILQLKEAVKTSTGLDPSVLVVIDVYHSRFHKVYYDKDPINHIMEKDDIYIYELVKPLGDAEWVPVPVYMREIKTHSSYSYYGGQKYTTYGQVFGLPIVVTVPRKGCTYKTLYDIICKQISRYTLGGEQEQEMEKVIENDDSQEPVEEMECEVTVEPEPSDDTSAVSKEVTPPVDNEEELTSESSSAKGQEDEGSAAVNEQQKDKNNDKMDADKQEMFKMVIVNSYGSQEVQKLTANSAQTLKLTSQTYIACDWDSDVKEKCYDISKADTYEEHESCKASKEEKKIITLLDCMDLFVQEETLGEEDAWFCPHCKDFVQASKKFDLWKMPEILVIHLKRFSYSRYYRNKIETRVDFPLQDLDLTKYVVNLDEAQPLYDLFAVSNHYGGLGGGHYTAYAKNKSTGKWHSFDDSHVSSVEADPKMICSSASYVLFYQRRTEGKRVPQVNRSLSVSFDEEVKEGQKKFHKGQVTQSMDVGSNKIEEEEEENNEDSAIEDDTQREEMKDIEKITGTENDD